MGRKPCARGRGGSRQGDGLTFMVNKMVPRGGSGSTARVYIDLYRVDNGKIAERWGFPEEIPPKEEWKNNNGML